jgi:hypothetical protein
MPSRKPPSGMTSSQARCGQAGDITRRPGSHRVPLRCTKAKISPLSAHMRLANPGAVVMTLCLMTGRVMHRLHRRHVACKSHAVFKKCRGGRNDTYELPLTCGGLRVH